MGWILGLVIEPLWEVCFASAKVAEDSRKCKFLSNYFLVFFLWVVNDILSVKNFFVRVSLSVTIYYYEAHLQRVAHYGLFLVVYGFVVSDG